MDVGTVIVGVAGIAATASLGIVSNLALRNRDRRNDERHLRDAQREQLASAYRVALRAALEAQRLANDLLFTGRRPGDPFPEVWMNSYRQTIADLQQARADLRLMPDAASCLEASDSIWSEFTRYRTRLEHELGGERNLNADSEDAYAAMEKAIEQLVDCASEQLRELSRPI